MKRVEALNGWESLNHVTLGFGLPSTLHANEMLLPSSILTFVNGIVNLGGAKLLFSLLLLLLDSRGLSMCLKASFLTIGVLSTPDDDTRCFLGCEGFSKYLNASGLTIGVVSI